MLQQNPSMDMHCHDLAIAYKIGRDSPKESKHPSFATEVFRSAVNLFSEFISRTLSGDSFRSIRDPHKTGLWDWEKGRDADASNPNLRIPDVAMVGKSVFLRGVGSKVTQYRRFLPIFMLPLTLIIGLLTLPFTILRTAIKFILLVPRICILRAEDRLRGIDYKHVPALLAELEKNAAMYSIEHYIRHKILHSNEAKVDGSVLKASLDKCAQYSRNPFGPGHFVYMTLYHLTFMAVLTAIPLLLNEFYKLPIIIPNVDTLYLSFGLIGFIFIAFMAINTWQCLKINSNFRHYFNSYYHTFTSHLHKNMPENIKGLCKRADLIMRDELEKMSNESKKMSDELTKILGDELTKMMQDMQMKKVKEAILERLCTPTQSEENGEALCTTEPPKASIIEQEQGILAILECLERKLAVSVCDLSLNSNDCTHKSCAQYMRNCFSLREGLRRGDNFACEYPAGLPMMDLYDATTDLGFVAEALITAPTAVLLRVIQMKKPFPDLQAQQP